MLDKDDCQSMEVLRVEIMVGYDLLICVNSIEKIRNTIQATLYDKISTDEESQHDSDYNLVGIIPRTRISIVE